MIISQILLLVGVEINNHVTLFTGIFFFQIFFIFHII
ncbi:hypothetical protein BVRB_4g088960 [Beta vulgaris subsp. vulgaris]|nr:hypothetical protein BVRB_4g088960 [Beta vulgaris subsp. vulgaris]